MIVKSLFGKIKGSAGGITVTNWKGKQVAKERITSNKSNSYKQIFQRARFAYVALFQKIMKGAILEPIWSIFERGTTWANEFSGFNIPLMTAFVTDLTPFVGDPLDISFSQGDLEMVALPTDALYNTADGVTDIAWDDAIIGNGELSDIVKFYVIDTSTKVLYTIDAIAREDEGAGGVLPTGLTATDLLFILIVQQVQPDSSNMYANSFSILGTAA